MFGALDGVLRIGDQSAVEHIIELVVLSDATVYCVLRPRRRLVEQLREVETLRLGVFDELRPVEHLTLADHLVEPPISHRRHQLPHFLGDKEEVVDDVLGLPDETLAQDRILRRDADWAGVQMAFAHHDAAGRYQRSGGEAELVRAQKRADHDVAAGSRRRRPTCAGDAPADLGPFIHAGV